MTTQDRSGRRGEIYHVSQQDIEHFREQGYVLLPEALTEAEIQSFEPMYQKFMRNEIPNMGQDFCDMSGPYGRPFEEFAIVNAVLARTYYPELQDNIYEKIARNISEQLIGTDITIDYDQLLAKKPNRPKAKFAWHQDQGYWPVGTPDTRTATCSLALDDADKANGCIRFVPGSNRARALRPHRPARMSRKSNRERKDAHTLILDVGKDETVVDVPVKRGGITVHDEWVVHGSPGNSSDRWRRTYVVAFRSIATVKYERSIGFTHSHNDTVKWETMLGSLKASDA